MSQNITIKNYTTETGANYKNLKLSYQLFGQELHTAPIICVNHALTGNAEVAGENGWWRELIAPDKAIDTNRFTVLAFNIPGNGYDGSILENYRDFTAKDIAKILLLGLAELKIDRLFALIGGSLGGGLAWEMVTLSPAITDHLIAIACDHKASDWLIANCHIQEQILLNSKQPLPDARKHAMLCYRTPQSFKQRFNRSKQRQTDLFDVESWLNHHGKKLQQRFQYQAYLLMNQLLKTIDVKLTEAIWKEQQCEAQIDLVAIDSDLFFPAMENRETQKRLQQLGYQAGYHQITSDHGHDAFLIEYSQLNRIIESILQPQKASSHCQILKFGGRSLANQNQGIKQVCDIIAQQSKQAETTIAIVSARADTTQQLQNLIDRAANDQDYSALLQQLKQSQQLKSTQVDYQANFQLLEKRLQGIKLLGGYNAQTRDEILAQGELMSVKAVLATLQEKGINASQIDSQACLKTNDNFGQATPLHSLSKANLQHRINQNPAKLYIAAGFIGSTEQGQTTTLGANGSNYTAALFANYLDATEMRNYTHVDGIYTADPTIVQQAQKIEQLSYREANELAQLGTYILHAKTIIPLIEKNISLRLLNTFKPNDSGTLISAKSKRQGIKCVSANQNVALINLEGRGMLGKPGIDGRIFGTLAHFNINVNMVSQSTTERGIGILVAAEDAKLAEQALKAEFSTELNQQDVARIETDQTVAVITTVGLSLQNFNQPLNALANNQISPLMINNSLNGKNISLVIKKDQLTKAVNVIHGSIFGAATRVHLALLGHGTVGKAMIEQILAAQQEIAERKSLAIKIIAIANSRQLLFDPQGIGSDWQQRLDQESNRHQIIELIDLTRSHHLENLILIDNTAGIRPPQLYPEFIKAGFDIVSSNKIANTLDWNFYCHLRKLLKQHKKSYRYETNVGAGLPLIDTIQSLHLAGENITAIRGIFSGSLSYIFNRLGREQVSFSQVLKDAMQQGFTEPDARDDLSGQDVARKLLILARELDLAVEMDNVSIENLVPQELRQLTAEQFQQNLDLLDQQFEQRQKQLPKNHVWRYLGELSGNLMDSSQAKLKVALTAVPAASPLGQVQGSDSIFEISTESYGKQPMIIQGAGAGAKVTARGVFGDILKLATQKT